MLGRVGRCLHDISEPNMELAKGTKYKICHIFVMFSDEYHVEI